jgi:hypothetical protein
MTAMSYGQQRRYIPGAEALGLDYATGESDVTGIATSLLP